MCPEKITESTFGAWADSLSIVTTEARPQTEGVSLQRAIGDLLRVVRDLLGLEVVFISEVADGRRTFRYVDAKTLPARIKPGQYGPLDQTICQRILDGRLPALIPDVHAVREEQGLPSNFNGIGAHIGVPVRRADGRLYGMLCGFSPRGPCELGDRDVGRLELAARAAARLLAHAEGHEADAGQ